MHRKTLLMVLLISTIATAGMSAQSASNVEIIDPADISGLRDPSGDPWTSYVDVAQFYPSIALRMIVGEAAVVRASDRTEIRWDHPLSLQKATPYLPLYEYNSPSYANEAITKPFILRSEDRLMMFRDFGFRFPSVTKDGAELSFRDGAAGMNISDTIEFRIEIVDAGDRRVIKTLDGFIVPPCDDWSKFTEVLARRAASPAFASASYPFLLTLIPDDDVLNRSIRLRATAVHRPSKGAGYEDRAIYMRFQGYERVSKHLIETWGELTADFEKKAETLIAEMGKQKAGDAIPYGKARDGSISIYPSVLAASEPDLLIDGGGKGFDGDVIVTIADAVGRVLHQERREAVSDADLMFRLPASALGSAVLFAFVRCGERFNYTLIRVTK